MTGREDRRDRSAVDWTELRERLDAAAETSSSPDRIQRRENDRVILDARADALSRHNVDASTAVATDVLVFSRGLERFGIDMASLLQVHRPRSITPLPGAEYPVLALVAWRGRPLTVVDVGTATGKAGSSGLRSGVRVLVVDHSSGAFGILADEVKEIRSVRDEDMLEVRATGPEGSSALEGLTRDAVTIVDAKTLANRIGAPIEKGIDAK